MLSMQCNARICFSYGCLQIQGPQILPYDEVKQTLLLTCMLEIRRSFFWAEQYCRVAAVRELPQEGAVLVTLVVHTFDGSVPFDKVCRAVAGCLGSL